MTTEQTQNPFDMSIKNLLTMLLQGVKQHGIPFLLLIIGIMYVENRATKIEQKYDNCIEAKEKMYTEVIDRLEKALDNNTRAFQNMNPKLLGYEE